MLSTMRKTLEFRAAASVLIGFLLVFGAYFADVSTGAAQTTATPSTTSRTSGSAQNAAAATDRTIAELSPQAKLVSQIAARNHDQNFLMVDKLHALLFYFKNGQPIYSDPVLTGASTADRFTPDILAKSFSEPLTQSQKITPAGRYTVTRDYDPLYGIIFEINEIHGKDWSLAIHTVYLGLPHEKRRERLQSPSPHDNLVTYGCMNIDADGIRFLARHLPKKGKTPLYILPRDESATATFFP